MTDPFSDDFDLDTNTDADTNTEENDVTESPFETTPARNTEVSVTLKGGRDFDAPWVVLRAPDAGTAAELLDEEMKELLKKAASFGKAFAQLGGGDKPAQSNGGGGNGGGGRQAPARQDHPDGKKEFCEHGEMKFLSGLSKKTGKPYSMFVCQSGDRATECKPKNA